MAYIASRKGRYSTRTYVLDYITYDCLETFIPLEGYDISRYSNYQCINMRRILPFLKPQSKLFSNGSFWKYIVVPYFKIYNCPVYRKQCNYTIREICKHIDTLVKADAGEKVLRSEINKCNKVLLEIIKRIESDEKLASEKLEAEKKVSIGAYLAESDEKLKNLREFWAYDNSGN